MRYTYYDEHKKRWLINDDFGEAVDKLAGYEDAEEQGRLVILPVKAGDTVYQLRDKKHALGVGVHPRHIHCVCVYGNDWIAEHQGDKPCAKKDLGKTWFLTRAEAEAALKGKTENDSR